MTGKRVGKYDIRIGSEVENGKASQTFGVSAFPGGRWSAVGGFFLDSEFLSLRRIVQYGNNNKKLWYDTFTPPIAFPTEIAVRSDDSVFVSLSGGLGSPGDTEARLYDSSGTLLNSNFSLFTARSAFGSAVDLDDTPWGIANTLSNDSFFRVDMSTLIAFGTIAQDNGGFKPSFDRSNGWISGGQIIYDTINSTVIRPNEGWIGVGGGYAWKRSTSDTVLECYLQSNLTGSPVSVITSFPDSSGNKAYTIGATNSRGQIVVTSGGSNDIPQEAIENIAVFAPDGSTLLRIDSGWRTNDSETQWRRAYCNDVCWSPDETEIIIGHQACDRFERPTTPP